MIQGAEKDKVFTVVHYNEEEYAAVIDNYFSTFKA